MNNNVFLKEKLIAHIDLNQFFIAVEKNLYPELKIDETKPVIIAHNAKNAIALTSNYYARKKNVFAGTPVFQARKIFPNNLLILEPHYIEYSKVSRNFFAFLRKINTDIEIASVDEAYVDLTTLYKKMKNVKKIVEYIKKQLRYQLNLECKIGVSHTKFLAKMASNLAKNKNQYFFIDRNSIHKVLDPLSIREIHGIGTQREQLLNKLGVYTVKDFLVFEKKSVLINSLGKNYYTLTNCLNGFSSNTLENTDVKSISIIKSFTENLKTVDSLKKECLYMLKIVMFRLNLYNKVSNTVCLKIKNEKALSKPKTFQKNFALYSNDFYLIKKTLLKLIEEKVKNYDIKSCGVELKNLIDYRSNTSMQFKNISLNNELIDTETLNTMQAINKNLTKKNQISTFLLTKKIKTGHEKYIDKEYYNSKKKIKS